jgi:uracil-DNA glycosylase
VSKTRYSSDNAKVLLTGNVLSEEMGVVIRQVRTNAGGEFAEQVVSGEASMQLMMISSAWRKENKQKNKFVVEKSKKEVYNGTHESISTEMRMQFCIMCFCFCYHRNDSKTSTGLALVPARCALFLCTGAKGK